MEHDCSYSVHKFSIWYAQKPIKMELKQLDQIDQIFKTISNTHLLCSGACSSSVNG